MNHGANHALKQLAKDLITLQSLEINPKSLYFRISRLTLSTRTHDRDCYQPGAHKVNGDDIQNVEVSLDFSWR